jgi:hypothetical protein
MYDAPVLKRRLEARTFLYEVPRDIYVFDDGLVVVRPPRALVIFPVLTLRLTFIGRPLMRFFGRRVLDRKAATVETIDGLTSADVASRFRGTRSLGLDDIKDVALKDTRSGGCELAIRTREGRKLRLELLGSTATQAASILEPTLGSKLGGDKSEQATEPSADPSQS